MPPKSPIGKPHPFARLAIAAAAALACFARVAVAQVDQTVPRPSVQRRVPDPRRYLVARASTSPVIDGRIDDAAWRHAPWTAWFTDIEGTIRPTPRFRTRVRMLWDDDYWYIAAEMQEPDLWATIRERDAVIFRDNDFEIFVNPSWTTHRYFEIEMNQFATVWDLFLPKPYRDEGSADNSWNIDGLKIAVARHGTINHPGDRDTAWTVELAIPWGAFGDSGRNRVPPRPGTQWRVNFSRVEWDVDTARGGYVKRTDAAGKPLPEHNWVWSPQGAINMHLPEMWGVVQFGGAKMLRDRQEESALWELRRVYYAERAWRAAHGAYAGVLSTLDITGLPAGVALVASGGSWQATLTLRNGQRWRIRDDGYVTRIPEE